MPIGITIERRWVLQAAGDRPYFYTYEHTNNHITHKPAAPSEQSEGGVTACIILYSKHFEILEVTRNIFI
jgi:hypothetical protein